MTQPELGTTMDDIDIIVIYSFFCNLFNWNQWTYDLWPASNLFLVEPFRQTGA